MTGRSLADRDVATVESFVADWLSQHGIPGTAVAIVDDDETVYAEGFGARDLESDTPATPDTLFGIASCTKSFTALAIMQLVERDEIALDDPVDDHLPHLAAAPGDPITVEDLLTHTSGMPSDETAIPRIGQQLGLDVDPVPLTSDEDFRRHLHDSTERRVTDRETFFYYNSGYTLLAFIVERVTEQSFTEYVRTQILAPMGIDRATFDEQRFLDTTDRMTPYLDRDDGLEPTDFPFTRFTEGSGGLLASVTDLATTLGLYLGDGTIDGETIVAPESVDAMTTPDGEFGRYVDGDSIGYGYGLMREPYLDDQLVGHGGDLAVSTAWFGYLEDARRGVVVACNTSPDTHPAEVGMAILALLEGRDPESVQPHYRLDAVLDAVSGTYTGYKDVTTATVEPVGGSLRLTIDAGLGEQELLLVPTTIDADRLVCTTVLGDGIERDVRFDLDSDPIDCFYERFKLQQTD